MPGPFLPLETGLQAVSVQLLSALTATAHFMTCYFFTFHIESSRERGKLQNVSARLLLPTDQKSCLETTAVNTNPNNTYDPSGNENRTSGRSSAGLQAAAEASPPPQEAASPPSPPSPPQHPAAPSPPPLTLATRQEPLH